MTGSKCPVNVGEVGVKNLHLKKMILIMGQILREQCGGLKPLNIYAEEFLEKERILCQKISEGLGR